MNEVTGGWGESSDSDERFILRLYIAGAAGNSSRAIANIKALCETRLAGRYELEIIDVHQDYPLEEEVQIIALPMLIRISPAPARRLIGDMSNTGKLLKGLGLE